MSGSASFWEEWKAEKERNEQLMRSLSSLTKALDAGCTSDPDTQLVKLDHDLAMAKIDSDKSIGLARAPTHHMATMFVVGMISGVAATVAGVLLT